MALDHVRDYVHITANTQNPLDLETTTPLLFFTRWITHFCAPVFILLSGTSIFLQGQRKTPAELGWFVLKRGCWLVLAEWTIVAFGWTFNPAFAFIPFQVIWAIGISMVILGLLLLIRVPFAVIVGLGAIIVLGHNLLDPIEQAPDFTSNFWWDITHNGSFTAYPLTGNHTLIVVYPFVPWAGLMMVGYGLGKWFTSSYQPEQRKRLLWMTGAGLLCVFVALRFSNLYGNPSHWSIQSTGLNTIFSFIDVAKYPPSLLYLCITIGIALIALSRLEMVQYSFTAVMQVFGRTAFFYYILHLYLIHAIATAAFFARGHSVAEATDTGGHFPFLFVAPGEGYGLGMVYLVWVVVVIALYPVCKWYDTYKQTHKEKWWLSYL